MKLPRAGGNRQQVVTSHPPPAHPQSHTGWDAAHTPAPSRPALLLGREDLEGSCGEDTAPKDGVSRHSRGSVCAVVCDRVGPGVVLCEALLPSPFPLLYPEQRCIPPGFWCPLRMHVAFSGLGLITPVSHSSSPAGLPWAVVVPLAKSNFFQP